MKIAELSTIDFTSQLKYCYEELQPLLEEVLDELRQDLMDLPDDASEAEKLACIEASVKALNEIDEDDQLEHGIDTDEREILCEFIYQMGEIVGLDSDTDYVDNWRDW